MYDGYEIKQRIIESSKIAKPSFFYSSYLKTIHYNHKKYSSVLSMADSPQINSSPFSYQQLNQLPQSPLPQKIGSPFTLNQEEQRSEQIPITTSPVVEHFIEQIDIQQLSPLPTSTRSIDNIIQQVFSPAKLQHNQQLAIQPPSDEFTSKLIKSESEYQSSPNSRSDALAQQNSKSQDVDIVIICNEQQQDVTLVSSVRTNVHSAIIDFTGLQTLEHLNQNKITQQNLLFEPEPVNKVCPIPMSKVALNTGDPKEHVILKQLIRQNQSRRSTMVQEEAKPEEKIILQFDGIEKIRSRRPQIQEDNVQMGHYCQWCFIF